MAVGLTVEAVAAVAAERGIVVNVLLAARTLFHDVCRIKFIGCKFNVFCAIGKYLVLFFVRPIVICLCGFVCGSCRLADNRSSYCYVGGVFAKKMLWQ